MKYKAKTKKKIKNIVISLLIILISIIGIVLFIENIEKEKLNKERYEAKSIEYTKYYEGKIFPSGVMQLNSLYTNSGGEISQEIYYQRLYKFVNYFKDIYDFGKNANSDEINKYFQDNSKSIKENIGIYDLENFNRIIEKIKKISIETESLENYKRSEINFNTFYDMEDVCVFDTIITYEGCDDRISVKTYLYKSKKKELDVYFDMK